MLKVLAARDAAKVAVNKQNSAPSNSLCTTFNLDSRLHAQADAIAAIGKLEKWRSSFHPLK